MNQANTLCMVAILIVMASLANTLCFGENPGHLGGWGPMMLMVCLPLASYVLVRIWVE